MRSPNDLWEALGSLAEEENAHVLTKLFAMYEERLSKNPESDKLGNHLFCSRSTIADTAPHSRTLGASKTKAPVSPRKIERGPPDIRCTARSGAVRIRFRHGPHCDLTRSWNRGSPHCRSPTRRAQHLAARASIAVKNTTQSRCERYHLAGGDRLGQRIYAPTSQLCSGHLRTREPGGAARA